jgi:hypothetical protein
VILRDFQLAAEGPGWQETNIATGYLSERIRLHLNHLKIRAPYGKLVVTLVLNRGGPPHGHGELFVRGGIRHALASVVCPRGL